MSGKDYEVGYGRPPRSGQFKNGESGNPRGRPPGGKNFATELRRELNDTALFRQGEVSVKMKKRVALAKSLIAKSLKGDVRALALLLSMMEKHMADEFSAESKKVLAASDAAILERYLISATDRSARKKPIRRRRRRLRGAS